MGMSSRIATQAKLKRICKVSMEYVNEYEYVRMIVTQSSTMVRWTLKGFYIFSNQV